MGRRLADRGLRAAAGDAHKKGISFTMLGAGYSGLGPAGGARSRGQG
jgi:hypothetical protein